MDLKNAWSLTSHLWKSWLREADRRRLSIITAEGRPITITPTAGIPPIRGIELGVIDYILKPIDEDELILAVQKAIRSIQLVRAQNAEQRRYESLCSAVNDLALRDFCNSYFDNEREALSLLDCMETVHIPQGYYTALYVELPNGSTPVEKIRETLVDVSRKLLCDNILHYKHTPTSFVLILITSTPPRE